MQNICCISCTVTDNKLNVSTKFPHSKNTLSPQKLAQDNNNKSEIVIIARNGKPGAFMGRCHQCGGWGGCFVRPQWHLSSMFQMIIICLVRRRPVRTIRRKRKKRSQNHKCVKIAAEHTWSHEPAELCVRGRCREKTGQQRQN